MDEPLIAYNILSYMDITDVLNCRLVSRTWNGEAVRVLSAAEFAFPLHARKKEISLNFSNLNSTLAKRVKASLTEVFPVQSIVPKNNLTSIFTSIGEKIEHLEFEWGDEWVPVFVEILNTFAFSNLISLKVVRTEFISLASEDSGNCILQRDEFHKLKELSFTITKHGEEGEGDEYFPVLQRIINKASNLQKLCLGTNFYPDLKKLTALKMLNVVGYSYKYQWPDNDDDDFGHTCSSICTCDKELVENSSFQLGPLEKMLTEVKNTLEILELHDEPQHNYGLPNSQAKRVPVVVPSMPKLKALKNYGVDTFPFRLDSQYFPKLEELLLRPECNNKAVDEFMRDLVKQKVCVPQVKKLTGIGLKALSTVPSVFPNLISITIEEIFDYAKIDSTDDGAEFARKCCTVVHGLPLLKQISVKCHHSNYDLKSIFRNLNMFVGCKELREITIDMKSTTPTNHGRELDDNVKNILLKFKGSNKFVNIYGIHMKNILGSSVAKFIAQENLPIFWTAGYSF